MRRKIGRAVGRRSNRLGHYAHSKWLATFNEEARETTAQALRSGKRLLAQAGIENAENEAAWLLCAALRCERAQLLLYAEHPLTPKQLSAYGRCLVWRAKRMPLQYILGNESFMGLEFYVSRAVLIPRPETELLAAHAIEFIKNNPQAEVLDLCTGSGAIGISAACLTGSETITCSDISARALRVAAYNANRLGASVRFVQSDLFEQLPGRYDLIVCNPPYITNEDMKTLQPEVAVFEPRLALHGGLDGLDFYRKIIIAASKHLNKNGRLSMELGIGQTCVRDMMQAFDQIEIIKDENGIDRMITGILREDYAG